MPGAAFVYGTLMADEVVKLLIARVPPSRPATLSGYTRYGIKGQVFPAIVPTQPTSVVKGKVRRGHRWTGGGGVGGEGASDAPPAVEWGRAVGRCGSTAMGGRSAQSCRAHV